MLDRIPRPRPDFQLQQLDQEIVLFHPSQSRVLYLNQSASVVWSLCDGARSVEEIIAVLTQAYPDAAAEIPVDVQATLQLFLDNDCIEMVDSAKP